MRISVIVGVFLAMISSVVSQDKYTFDCHSITNACKNGGVCVENSNDCVCPTGFEGYDCGYVQGSITCGTLPSIGDPCQNGGICYKSAVDNSVALCYCKYGYQGDTCEEEIVVSQDKNIFDCRTISNACKNGGTCGDDSSDCVCLTGFEGFDCGYVTGSIACGTLPSIGDPCQNGGICYKSAVDNSVALCYCKYGYQGDTCEEEIVVSQDKNTFDCRTISNACKNGGICGDDSSDCVCLTGFEGFDCGYVTSSIACGTLPSIGDPCQNGGICYKSAVDNSVALCYCKYGYHGDTCEEEIVVSKDKNTFDCRTISNACKNGGSCGDDSSDCVCLTGFEGFDCGYVTSSIACDTSPSIDDPCQNGGLCYKSAVDNSVGLCYCKYGYHGDTCIEEIVVSQDKYTFDCHRLPNVCKNGGSCGDSKDCVCEDGYGGYDCGYVTASVACDADSSTECKNGGRCYKAEGVNSVDQCYCKYGYHGDTCEDEIVDITCGGMSANYSLSFPQSFAGKVILVDENGASLEDVCPLTIETASGRITFKLTVEMTDDQDSGNCKVENILKFNETYQAKLRVYYNSMLMTSIDEVYTLNCTHQTDAAGVSVEIQDLKINDDDLNQVDDGETFTPVVLEAVDDNDEIVGQGLSLGEVIRLHLFPSQGSGYAGVFFETCIANNTLTGENGETPMSLKFLDKGCPTQEGMVIYTAQETKNKTLTGENEDIIVQGKAVKFSAFKFSNSDNIGIVCNVKACRAGSTSCDLPQNCTAIMKENQANDGNDVVEAEETSTNPAPGGRRKRAADDGDDENTVSKVFNIVGKKEKTNEKTSETESVDPLEECMARAEITAVIAILGAVVCVLLIVCFFLVCVILRRKGKRTTTYDPTLFQPKPDRYQIPRAHVNESYEIM